MRRTLSIVGLVPAVAIALVAVFAAAGVREPIKIDTPMAAPAG